MWNPRALCWLLTVAALAGLAHAAPAVFVQISDIHLSTFAAEQWSAFGDKEGDTSLIANSVLAAIQPQAVMLTGDLADSKTPWGQGHQYEAEWKAYRRILDALAKGTGLPETAILDIRGNHDDFDVPSRGGPGDFFPKYSAAGRRNATARVYLHPVYTPNDKACPALLLLGFDATPNPGLRGPTNFVALMPNALLAEIDATLTSAKAEYRNKECEPAVVSYGHHPLPTIALVDQPPWTGIPGSATLNGAYHAVSLHAQHSAAAVSRQSVHDVLGKHGVLAYLNGHLHGAFGQMLHKLHSTPTGGRFAELEAAAWKDDRRFRVMTLDQGTFAFADLIFNTPSKPASPRAPAPSQHFHVANNTRYSIGALLPSQHVRNHLVVMTSPPDARYAPVGADVAPGGARTFSEVRALVLPVSKDGSAKPQKVYVRWQCADTPEAGTIAMSASSAQQAQHAMYTGKWNAGSNKPVCQRQPSSTNSQAVVHLEVVVEDSEVVTSTSGRHPVALQAGSSGPSGAQQVLSEPDQPLPISLQPLEWLVMSGSWAVFGYRLFYTAWAFWFLVLLLLPRVCGPAVLKYLGPGAREGGLSWLTWPAVVLSDMAADMDIWLPQVLYSLYVLCGPWFVARLLSASPPGLFFPGMLLVNSSRDWWPLSRWQLAASPDAMFLGSAHLLSVVLPLTLWLACVVSRWQYLDTPATASRGQPAGKPGHPGLLSPLQWLAGFVIFSWHLRVVWRLCLGCYGWLAVALSPGIGWTSMLVAGLLGYVYFSKKPMSPGSASPKYE